MKKFEKIAAFGAGSGLIDLLAIKPKEVVLTCVADNNVGLHGTEIRGVNVVSAEQLAQESFDAVVITAGAVDLIRGQLIDLGVKEDAIIAICPSASQTLHDAVNLDIVRLNEGLGITLPEAGISTMYLRVNRDNFKSSAWPVDFVRNQTFNLCMEQIREKGVPGAVAELGVFKGDQAHLISNLFPDRRLHLFDTFEGFSEKDLESEKTSGFSNARTGDFSDTSIEIVLEKIANPSRVVIHKGYFPDTADNVVDAFAFVSIDVDLYDPTVAGLEWFYPRMSSNGYIFVHDYNNDRYKGVRKAVDEFSLKAGIPIMPICDFSGSAVIMKM